MKYNVRISELRYGRVEVEAENEQQAKELASGKEIEWVDCETTDMTAEPVGNLYEVAECCPHCESEIEMMWNTETMGFKAFCPVCGGRLMLCDECRHSGKGVCDYCRETDSCKHNPISAERLKDLWAEFGDLPMNPETECMEAPFLHFPAGTHREEIWHWFDRIYPGGVYRLMFPSAKGGDEDAD